MMEGVSSLEQLCHAARQYGMDTLALTDTNGLYGAIRFIEVARQYGIKPILGAELRQGVRRAVEAIVSVRAKFGHHSIKWAHMA